MLGLGHLRNGIRRLADALHGLADLVEGTRDALRSQMHLTAADNELPPVVSARVTSLPAAEQEGEGNGEAQPTGKKGRKS